MRGLICGRRWGGNWRLVGLARLPIAGALFLSLVAAAPASSSDDENYKVSDGLGVYVGLLPAALIKGHPANHPETTMHGGVPSGAHEYHS
jgi:hypothetical protein